MPKTPETNPEENGQPEKVPSSEQISFHRWPLPVYEVLDPQTAHHVFTSDVFGKTELEAELPSALLGQQNPILHATTSVEWQKHRRITDALIKAVGSDRADRKAALTTLMHERVANLPVGQVINANTWATQLASSAIFTSLFGRVDLLTDTELSELFQLFDEAQSKLAGLYLFGVLIKKAPEFAQSLVAGVVRQAQRTQRLAEVVNKIEAYIRQVLAKNTHDTYFSQTIHSVLKTEGDSLVDETQLEEIILSQAKTMVLAGTDTTSSQLATAMRLLASDANLQKEWLDQGAAPVLTRLGNEHAPLKLYRKALQEVVLAGEKYPKGTVFMVDPQKIHRQVPASSYGASTTFGYPDSPRVCAGKPLAVLELTMALEALRARCLNYQLELVYVGQSPIGTKGSILSRPADARIKLVPTT